MSRQKLQQELREAVRVQEYEEQKSSEVLAGGGGGGGLLPFVLKPEDTQDRITARAGLPLVVEAFRGYRGDDLVRAHVQIKKRARGYDEVEYVEDLLLLLASGGEHLEDLAILGEDAALCRLLDRRLPSPDAARNFLLRFHDEKLIEQARERAEQAGEKSYVPEENQALQGLGQVLAVGAQRMADPQISTCATLDHDATVINSYKEEAKWHYKGDTGYQPVAMLWAEQDLVVADEFRDGNVPAGKDNLRLIQRAFTSLPAWVSEMRFRADTACYEEEVLKWLADPRRVGGPAGKIGFTISADMTAQLRALCEDVLSADSPGSSDLPRWTMLDDTRADETAEWAEVEFTPGDWSKEAQPLRYLVLRFLRRQGKLFSSGETVKHLAVVTNREGDGAELIRWHWKKAGTIEHLHDETKNDLGAGVFPCAGFGANAAWYRLTMLTYNILTAIKRRTLPANEQRSKAKRVRFLLFDVAARITVHAHRMFVHVKQAALHRSGYAAARAFFVQARKGSTAQSPV